MIPCQKSLRPQQSLKGLFAISSSTCSCGVLPPDVTVRLVFSNSEKYHQQNVSYPFNTSRDFLLNITPGLLL